MDLLTADATIALLAVQAQELGHVVFVSGKLRVDVECREQSVIWYLNERRASEGQVVLALEKARAARVLDQPV